jgi:hypothetical protein
MGLFNDRESASPLQRQFEPHALRLLQRRKDAAKVRGRRVALWPQHAHEALGWNPRALFKLLKSNRSVHIVAEHGLAGFKVAGDDAFDGFAQKSLSEIRISLRPRSDGFFESRESGALLSLLFFPPFVISPTRLRRQNVLALALLRAAASASWPSRNFPVSARASDGQLWLRSAPARALDHA